MSEIKIKQINNDASNEGGFIINSNGELIWSNASNSAVQLPSGSTANRPIGSNGLLRYNTDLNKVENFLNSTWAEQIDEFDRRIFTENIIKVQTNPGKGEFSSIKAAMDSITTNSASNRFVIEVGPGLYIEDTIVMKQYVSIVGYSPRQTIIEVNNPSKDVIIVASNCDLNRVGIQGASNSGKIGINIEDVTNFSAVNIIIRSCANGIKLFGNTINTRAIVREMIIEGDNDLEHCVLALNNSGISAIISVATALFTDLNSSVLDSMVLASGSGTQVTLAAISIINSFGTSIGDGIRCFDGASLRFSGVDIDGFNNGLVSENTGSAPFITILGTIIRNSIIKDINIAHPGTTGSIQTQTDRNKVNVDPSAPISVFYTDIEQNGTIILGKILFGKIHDSITDISDLIVEEPTMGMLDGGLITKTINPLEISISEGFGYLNSSTTLQTIRIEWPITTLILPDNDSNFIFVNENGIVTFAGSNPNTINNILLGRVRTENGNVDFIARIPLNTRHINNKFDKVFRDAIGPIYSSGSIVSENPGTPRALDVSNGIFYFSQNEFNPTGGVIIDFDEHFRSGGGFIEDGPFTQVDNTSYDSGTGLVPLTSGFFTKHVLFVAGDGADEEYALVIGQEEFSDLNAARAANPPSPPPTFTDVVISIAEIIVQEGNPNIVEILDVRPVIAFRSAALAGALNHGNLAGLLGDDHPQYFLANGNRTMSGSVNMGGFSITNVNLVDGVDVSSHASRHLPNGLDPITTASAITLTPSSTNTEGIQNSLARSDHTHLISGFQPLDSDLTALANIVTTGFYTITGSGTSITRTILGTANQISLINGDGIAGDPTIFITDNPILPGNASVTIPIGTTAQRPGSPVNGMVRYNSTINRFEGHEIGNWSTVGMGDTHPGFVNGRYYGTFYTTRNWTTQTITVDTLYAVPFYTPVPTIFTRIGIELTSTNGTLGRLGIYNNINGSPNQLVLDAGTFSTTTTGIKELVISQTLAPGWYWLVVFANGTPTFRALNTNAGDLPQHWIVGAPAPNAREMIITAASTFGTLPASFPTKTYVNVDVPYIWLRIV